MGNSRKKMKAQHTENKMDSLTLTRAIQIETTAFHFPPIFLAKHNSGVMLGELLSQLHHLVTV